MRKLLIATLIGLFSSSLFVGCEDPAAKPAAPAPAPSASDASPPAKSGPFGKGAPTGTANKNTAEP